MGNISDDYLSSVSPVRLSTICCKNKNPNLFALRDDILDYLNLNSLDSFDWLPVYSEIALIIAEIYICHPKQQYSMAGQVYDAEFIRNAFDGLERQNIEFVIDNIINYKSEIKNKKSFIRTALYNSLFETNIGKTNDENRCYTKDRNMPSYDC
jgi:hypothetical protein